MSLEIIPEKFDDVFYLGYQAGLEVVVTGKCEKKSINTQFIPI